MINSSSDLLAIMIGRMINNHKRVQKRLIKYNLIVDYEYEHPIQIYIYFMVVSPPFLNGWTFTFSWMPLTSIEAFFAKLKFLNNVPLRYSTCFSVGFYFSPIN